MIQPELGNVELHLRDSAAFKVSVIIPVFNEESNIEFLVQKLSEILLRYSDYEVLFVDDGSTDNTLESIKQCNLLNLRVNYISFSRNFGHQNALRAGIDMCSGDVVITMDGDHQHPPELIPQMIGKWIDGYDVVYTTRNDSDCESIFKKYSSSLFYAILNKISDIDLQKGSADFRLFDKKVIVALRTFKENSIFYRGVIAWLGYKQFELKYEPEKRFKGVSKYTLRKMVAFAFDGISSFSFVPLRLAAIIGGGISSLSFLYVIYAICIKLFTENAVSGWLSIMAGIYLLGGVQLLFLGVCGEYIGRIFMEVKMRPNYIISESSIKK